MESSSPDSVLMISGVDLLDVVDALLLAVLALLLEQRQGYLVVADRSEERVDLAVPGLCVVKRLELLGLVSSAAHDCRIGVAGEQPRGSEHVIVSHDHLAGRSEEHTS